MAPESLRERVLLQSIVQLLASPSARCEPADDATQVNVLYYSTGYVCEAHLTPSGSLQLYVARELSPDEIDLMQRGAYATSL